MAISSPAVVYCGFLYRSMDNIQGRFDVAYEAAGGLYGDFARCATGRYRYQCAYSAYYLAVSIELLHGWIKVEDGAIWSYYLGMAVQLSF